VSATFGSLEKPWKPGYLRSAYGAICCHKFKPKNQTDDIFLAQILGNNSRFFSPKLYRLEACSEWTLKSLHY
jgi:Telomere resolvase